jgi:hypothetical protein
LVLEDEKHICFAQGDWGESGSSPVPYFYGRSNKVHVDRKLVMNFNLHFYVEAPEARNIVHYEDLICVEYSRSATQVQLHLATSLISKEQAKVRAIDVISG